MRRERGVRLLLLTAGIASLALLVALLLASRGRPGPAAAGDAEPRVESAGPPRSAALEGRPRRDGETRGRAEAAPRAPAGEARGPGTLRVRFLWETTRAPLTHMPVDVLLGDGVPLRRMVTDAEGRAEWEGAPAGTLTLRVAIEAWFHVDLPSGGVAEKDLLVAEGIRIAGTVRDEGGRPVPGASIWLALSGLSNEGEVVALADRDGAYGLRIAATDACVGAHARGHGPSLRRFVEGQAGETVTQDLVLQGAGGSLRVRVVGPDGAPAPAANVLVGTADIQSTEVEGVLANLPTAFTARTDAAGEASFDGLPVGEQPVRVLAHGHPMQAASVAIDPDRPASLDVRLAARAVVAGTARGPQGVPLEGVRVKRFFPPGDDPPFAFDPAATTDAEGRYELDGLPLGDVVVQASGPRAPILSVRTTLALVEGSTTRWDPILPEGARILGRLVDPDGKGRPGWRVRAWSGSWRRAGFTSGAHGETDAEGRFTLDGLLDLPHRVEAWAPGGDVAPAGVWLDVLPGGPERPFVVPQDAALAGLKGRLVDAAGRPPRGLLVGLSLDAVREPYFVPVDESGAFVAASLSAGRYRLTVLGREVWMPPFDAGEVTVGPGQQRDLGTLALPAMGGLRVLVSPAGGTLDPDLEVALVQGDRTVATAPVSEGSAEFRTVYVGGYRVELRGDAVGERAACEVRAGVVTEVRLAASPGYQRVFAIRVPRDAAVPSRLHVEVVGPDGRIEVVQDRAVPDLGDTSRDADEEARTGLRPLAWSVVNLRPGAWTLRATTDTDLAATLAFRADDASPSGPIEVVLRSGR